MVGDVLAFMFGYADYVGALLAIATLGLILWLERDPEGDVGDDLHLHGKRLSTLTGCFAAILVVSILGGVMLAISDLLVHVSDYPDEQARHLLAWCLDNFQIIYTVTFAALLGVVVQLRRALGNTEEPGELTD